METLSYQAESTSDPKLTVHGENDFVSSTKRFVNTASANQNC